jgi:hypothetical protein
MQLLIEFLQISFLLLQDKQIFIPFVISVKPPLSDHSSKGTSKTQWLFMGYLTFKVSKLQPYLSVSFSELIHSFFALSNGEKSLACKLSSFSIIMT